jgi:lactoylglutathione lyase
MIRVKDAEKSLKFYQDVMGMKLVRTVEATLASFNLYFLGYETSEETVPHREGLLELTWNYGTEKDPNFKYHDGNTQPQGFGHICLSVDDLQAACDRFEEKGVSFEVIFRAIINSHPRR